MSGAEQVSDFAREAEFYPRLLAFWDFGSGELPFDRSSLTHWRQRLGVKFAKAFGAHVVMVTTSPEKGKDALRLGADEVLVSKNPYAMAKAYPPQSGRRCACCGSAAEDRAVPQVHG